MPFAVMWYLSLEVMERTRNWDQPGEAYRGPMANTRMRAQAAEEASRM